MKELITNAVRTAIQAGVASLAAWLLSVGIDIGEATTALQTGLFMLTMAVVTFLLNWAGKKWPIVHTIMSLGISKQGPSYQAPGNLPDAA